MITQIDGEGMRQLARIIKNEIPGLGFCLLVFEFEKPGISNYISNAQRPDMLKAIQETLDRLNGKQDFKTPEKEEN